MNEALIKDKDVYVMFQKIGKETVSALGESVKYKMISVSEYCKALDVHYMKHFDFFEHFKKNG